MIAAEGFWYVIIPMLLFLLAAFLGIWRKKAWLFLPAGLFLLIWFAMLYFFRDPARPQPDPHSIVSVSDGIVDEIIPLSDGRVKVEVFLSLLNVHALRSPVTGVVSGYEFIPGDFIAAQFKDAIDKNQRVTVDMMTMYGPLQFSALTGAIARRVVLPLNLGDELLSGQRIGFVRFGSRSELVLPSGMKLQVQVGDKVYGGVTVVAEFVGREEPVPEPNGGQPQ